MKLHELKPKFGSKFRKKEVGRGLGSGHGTYSTRGMKGQKARSGARMKPGFEGGQTSFLRHLPKLRGFKSIYEKSAILNLEDLQKNFKTGDKITKAILEKKKIIKSAKASLKILGDGELTKKLVVEANAFSKSAKEKIEKAGGKAIIL
ncbi:MAG: 50S ribosomal protein L15 [Patescibacteria group bacterium]